MRKFTTGPDLVEIAIDNEADQQVVMSGVPFEEVEVSKVNSTESEATVASVGQSLGKRHFRPFV